MFILIQYYNFETVRYTYDIRNLDYPNKQLALKYFDYKLQHCKMYIFEIQSKFNLLRIEMHDSSDEYEITLNQKG